MIKDIMVGNILDTSNRADIIIGMNSALHDVRGIGRPFVTRIEKTRAIKLGSVVSFDYDGKRELHMLICHALGKGGWKDADQFVRYGMDYLWSRARDRSYSIVNIGKGRVGQRDGADHAAIRSAIASSYLPVYLYVLNEPVPIPAEAAARLVPFRVWDIAEGEASIKVAA